MILLDTSVLIRSVRSPRALLAHDPDEPRVLVPQCVVEFWSVATRPVSANGMGMTPAEARVDVDGLLSIYPLLPDSPRVHTIWLDLVTSKGVSGKHVHDARIVAAMLCWRIDRILTANPTDFVRYDGITVVPLADPGVA